MTVLTGAWDGSRIRDPITAHIPLTGPAARSRAGEDSIDLLSETARPPSRLGELCQAGAPSETSGAAGFGDSGAEGEGAQGAGRTSSLPPPPPPAPVRPPSADSPIAPAEPGANGETALRG